MSSTLTSPSRMPLALREPDAFAGPVLQVIAGVHSGVRVPIDGSSCTIGHSRNSDLILADDAVADDHVRLRFYGKTVAIDAVGGDVMVKGGVLLRRGQGCKASLPAEIGLGAARISIGQARLSAPVVRRLLTWIGLLTLVVVPIVAVQANILTAPEAAGMAEPPTPAANLRASLGPAPAAAAFTPSDADVATLLQQKIEAAGLGQLKVLQDGRHFQVSGALPPAGRTAWEGVQRWFDGQLGQRYVLTSTVGAAAIAKAPQFDFQAVWFGKDPYVIDAKGERRYPGAALRDGWAIKSIRKGHILLTRGGEEFALTL